MNTNQLPLEFTNDQVALVTGAASGIGRATAFAFAERGVRTVLSDVSEQGEAVASEITKKYDIPSVFIKCDVSKADEVSQLIQQTVKQFGRLDFAFNNAGIEGVPAPTKECTEENWDRVININLKGVWLCMKYELEPMLKQGSGVIVNCSSIAGVTGFANTPAYSASKHGVIGLTKAAALEYAEQGIRINAMCPGVIITPMIDRFTSGSKEAEKQLARGAPMARAGQPNEIAKAVVWMCSPEASFMTGHAMVIDGGWVAR